MTKKCTNKGDDNGPSDVVGGSDDIHAPTPNAVPSSLSTIIKIAPSAQEKKAQKDFEADLALMGTEKKGVANKRDHDIFFSGPMHGLSCLHQPNGPPASWDPKGHWSDYFFFDRIPEQKFGRKIRGYHVYSSARGLYPGGRDPVGRGNNMHGTRGPLFMKCYYYCGFLEEGVLVADGIHPSDFKGVLTVQ